MYCIWIFLKSFVVIQNNSRNFNLCIVLVFLFYFVEVFKDQYVVSLWQMPLSRLRTVFRTPIIDQTCFLYSVDSWKVSLNSNLCLVFEFSSNLLLHFKTIFVTPIYVLCLHLYFVEVFKDQYVVSLWRPLYPQLLIWQTFQINI